jgi:tetratricopeptide (TPR) repeat protein
METMDVAQLVAEAERLSPERSPEQAVELNQRIVRLDPRNAAAYVRLARAYQAQRNFAAAADACQEALQCNPGSAVAQRRLQHINEEWDFYKKAQAIQTYDEALRRGVANKDQELVGLAIAYLWSAVELSTSRSQSIICRNALAAAYRSKKDPASLDMAASMYELVLRHAPGNLAAMIGLAAVLRDQGKLSQARQLYEQVLALDPRNSHALTGLGGVLHDQGEEVLAQEHFRQGSKQRHAPRSNPHKL